MSAELTPDILFSGVRILADGVDLTGDLLVRDGVIADFGPSLGRPDGATVVREDGAMLIPGLVDMRAALGEPGYEYRETIESAAKAAAAGGITTSEVTRMITSSRMLRATVSVRSPTKA